MTQGAVLPAEIGRLEISEYYYAAPQEPVPLPILQEVLRTPDDMPSSDTSLVVASAMLELAVHPSLSQDLRIKHAKEAGLYILKQIMMEGTDYERDKIAPLRAHLPLFVHGALPRARELVRREVSEQVGGAILPQCLGKDAYGSLRGSSMEGLVDLTLGHTGIAGLTVTHATHRQDIGLRRVDGKAYAWDLTVHSSGEVLDRGEYRVQVKSKDARGYTNKLPYHPDIAVVYGDTHLGIEPGNPWDLARYFKGVVGASHEGGSALDIRRARGALLAQLDTVGPVKTEESVLPAA
jgi:hypothetical protein